MSFGRSPLGTDAWKASVVTDVVEQPRIGGSCNPPRADCEFLRKAHTGDRQQQRKASVSALCDAYCRGSRAYLRPSVRSEAELANLTLAVTAINSWNRMNIAFRKEAGKYQPPKVAMRA